MLFLRTDTPLTKAARELEYVALLMATKSIPSYRRELRAAARALWNGTWTDFDFYADMLAIIRRNFTQAFHEGAATCGITPDELSREEALRLEQEIVNESQYIDGLADFIVLHSKANGGKLATVFRRVEVWVNAWTRIKTLAQTLVCGDLKYVWTLHPAEHCFVAGTKIAMADGTEKNIEDVRRGDCVKTSHGNRRVTRLFKNPYKGELRCLSNDTASVTCTPNHPFLTQDGWKRADDVGTSDKLVFLADFLHDSKAHVAFPNALDEIPARGEVFVLGGIAPLLLNLAFSERIKSRMSMPVISIGLNNKFSDFGIYDKLRLNNGVWLVINAKIVQTFVQKLLKSSGFVFLLFLSSLCQILASFFETLTGMVLDLFDGNWIPHRVTSEHILPRRVMNSVVKDASIKPYAQAISHILDNLTGYPHFISDGIGSMQAKFLDYQTSGGLISLQRPESGCRNASTTRTASLGSTLPHSATDGAELFATYGARRMRLSPGLVPASRRAELHSSLLDRCRRIVSSDDDPTMFASKSDLSSSFPIRHLASPLLLSDSVHSSVLYTEGTNVYNLEIEEVNNYFANGILVHNCRSCKKLSGKVKRGSFWAKHVQPKNFDLLACRMGCKCTLDVTDLPLTRGPLPYLP